MADEAKSAETGEEAIPPAVRRRLQQCYDHATRLSKQEKYDVDYGNSLLTDCAKGDPGNLAYVEAFLENLQRKYNNNKKGATLRGFGGKGGLKKAVAREDWREVLNIGPTLLASNPWDASVLRPMAQACEALGYYDVELRYLKNALDANPKDAEVNRHCAKSLAAMALFDQALTCWARVQEAKPHDKEAEQWIGDLTIERQRAKAGIRRSGESKIVIRQVVLDAAQAAFEEREKNKGRANDSEDEDEASLSDAKTSGKIELTRRQVLERAVVDSPGVLENYLELAQILREEGKFNDAERVLNKSLTVAGQDLEIMEQIEDVQMERYRQQLKIAERQAAKEKSARSLELVQDMRDEVNRRELDILRRRSDRLPGDVGVKFEVAVRLKALDKPGEAVRWFMEARDDSAYKAKATLESGECLQKLKKYENAMKCYLRAVEIAGDDEDVKKLSLYRAGVLATGMKDYETAESSLKSLSSIDAGFRDLPDRLDKLAKIRHSG